MNLDDHTPLRTLQVQARRGAGLMDRVRPGWYLCINLYPFEVRVAWHPVLDRFLKRILPHNERRYGFFGNSVQDDKHLTRLWKFHIIRRMKHKKKMDSRPIGFVPLRTSQVRVKRGAEFMDSLIPGWYDDVDLETFDITALDNDVMDQINTGHVSTKTLKDYGFIGMSFNDDAILNRLWRYHVRKREKHGTQTESKSGLENTAV